MTVTSEATSAACARGLAGPCKFYDAAGFQPTHSVGHLMRQVIASLRQQTDHALAPKNLTHAQWVPLFKLSLRGVATAAELAVASQLDASAMTRTLDRLEKKGLVRRQRSVVDRRVVHVGLTDQGQAVASAIPQVLCKVLNDHLAGFSADEGRQLEALLGRMLANGLAQQSPLEPAARMVGNGAVAERAPSA